MDRDLLVQLLEDRPELKTLPQTLSQIISLARDDAASANEIAAVIAKDPPLAAKLLRLANAPYYGLPQPTASVKHAVVTVGVQQVTALALASTVYSLSEQATGPLDRVAFWRDALSVALASRSLAEAAGRFEPDAAYIAGLLHHLGLLVLSGSFPDQFATIWKDVAQHGQLVARSEAAWGTNHALVGKFLLEQWGLPSIVSEAVGNAEMIFSANSNYDDLHPAQVVALAADLSPFALLVSGNSPQAIRERHGKREILRKNLGVDAATVQAIEADLFADTMREASFLELTIGDDRALLYEANRLLAARFAALEELLRENQQLHRELRRGVTTPATDHNRIGRLEELTTQLRADTLALRESVLSRDPTDMRMAKAFSRLIDLIDRTSEVSGGDEVEGRLQLRPTPAT